MDLSEKTVHWTNKKPTLIQIYTRGLEMCFVGPDGADGTASQACDFVLCKDFLQDAVQGHLLNESRSIYGFTYNPKEHAPLNMERVRIAVGNAAEKDLGGKIPAVLDFLHQYERRLHLLRTRVWRCATSPDKYKDSGGCYLFEGSGRWLLSPPMLSLYTLLLRSGFSHPIGQTFDSTVNKLVSGEIKPYSSGVSGNNDSHYMKAALVGMKKLETHGYRKVFHRNVKDNYPSTVGVGTMHNSCGIVGFSNGSCKGSFPHWFRLDQPAAKRRVVKKVA
jgi:hypothetical protein